MSTDVIDGYTENKGNKKVLLPGRIFAAWT